MLERDRDSDNIVVGVSRSTGETSLLSKSKSVFEVCRGPVAASAANSMGLVISKGLSICG